MWKVVDIEFGARNRCGPSCQLAAWYDRNGFEVIFAFTSMERKREKVEIGQQIWSNWYIVLFFFFFFKVFFKKSL